MQPRPACGSTDTKEQPSKYALLKLEVGGTIPVNPDTGAMEVFTVRLSVCNACGYLAMYDVPTAD